MGARVVGKRLGVAGRFSMSGLGSAEVWSELAVSYVLPKPFVALVALVVRVPGAHPLLASTCFKAIVPFVLLGAGFANACRAAPRCRLSAS